VEGVRRRILLITPFAPARGEHGGVQVLHGLLSGLAERHELVVLHLERERAMDPELAARCVAVHALPVEPLGRWSRRAVAVAGLLRGRSVWAYELGGRKLRRRVGELAREFQPDVVQVEYGVVGEALSAAGPRALRIVTIHDPAASLIEYVPMYREGLVLAHRLDAWSALREERRILSLADAAVVFSEWDRRRLAENSRSGAATLVVVPLGWEVPHTPLDPCGTHPPSLLFVGNFLHPPNVEAALSLARTILRRVRAVRPDVILDIVGGSPPPELLAMSSDAVRITGAVPSVTPHLDRAAVVVAPIAIGGGARVKVLEALAAGKAVVASTRAAEGITARAGEELIVADGDSATAAAIIELIQDEQARRELASRARAWALRELTWSAMADRYDELYDRVEQRSGASGCNHGRSRGPQC
jgi:glycosyltransferase involved in cell wall biosynthesis